MLVFGLKWYSNILESSMSSVKDKYIIGVYNITCSSEQYYYDILLLIVPSCGII